MENPKEELTKLPKKAKVFFTVNNQLDISNHLQNEVDILEVEITSLQGSHNDLPAEFTIPQESKEAFLRNPMSRYCLNLNYRTSRWIIEEVEQPK
jgi:hypothetical protein